MTSVDSTCWPLVFQNYVHASLSRSMAADGKEHLHRGQGLPVNRHVAAKAHADLFLCLTQWGSSPNLGLPSAASIEM